MARSVVLVIKDPNILYLLRRYLEECGMQPAIPVRDGALVEVVLQADPELIITDAARGEPQFEGIEALSGRAETRQIPILQYSLGDSISATGRSAQGSYAVSGYLEEYVMYEQFVAALRRVGVQPREEVARA